MLINNIFKKMTDETCDAETFVIGCSAMLIDANKKSSEIVSIDLDDMCSCINDTRRKQKKKMAKAMHVVRSNMMSS